MIKSITVPCGGEVNHDWEVGKNCYEINGPYTDICSGVYWEVVTKDRIYHEYFVYSVEYEKGGK